MSRSLYQTDLERHLFGFDLERRKPGRAAGSSYLSSGWLRLVLALLAAGLVR